MRASPVASCMPIPDYYCVEFHIDNVDVNSKWNWSDSLDLVHGRQFCLILSHEVGERPEGHLVLRVSAQFFLLALGWAKVRTGRCCCSADSISRIDIIVSVQFGAGASRVARTCLLPQVTTTGREGPPASATEITRIWSSDSMFSTCGLIGAYLAALTCSSCLVVSGTIHSDVECIVRPQLMEKATVP